MNCTEVRNKTFDFCEQFGPHAKLHNDIAQHIASCENCAAFYDHMVQDGFLQIEQEKQAEVNPYLINKILLKTTEHNNSSFKKKVFYKTPIYITSVLLAGILTGILVSGLASTEADTTEQTTKPNDVTTSDANTSSDNSTLTLTDW